MIFGRITAAALLCLATGCVSTVSPAGALPEGETRIVGEVDIRGNDEVSDDAIVDGLALRPPTGIIRITRTSFDPVALELDRRRIVAYYHQRGFFSARVTNVSTARTSDDRVQVTFQVDEGPQTTVQKVAVSGAAGLEGFERDELLDTAGIEIGDDMIYERYEEVKGTLRDVLVERGYAFAKVEGQIEVDREEARAGVLFFVDAGPRVRFGEPVLSDTGLVPPEAVRARVVWDEGEIFDPELLEETRLLLYELGRFSVVRFDLDREARPEVADVEIVLSEATRHEVKLGIGAGIDRTRYQARLRAAYTEKGFWLPLMTLRLEARPSYSFIRQATGVSGIGGEASAGLDLDDFLSPRLRLGNLLSYSDQDFQAYSIRGPRYRISLQRPFIGDDLRLGVGWSIRYQMFPRVDAGIGPEQQQELGIDPDGRYRVGAFDQSIVWDRRNDPLDTREGYYAEVRLEESGPYAGSAFEYLRVIPELRGYWSPLSRLVLAGRARYGRTILDQGVLPITQRFFAGGASSHRGFSFQRLSPMITSEEGATLPVGGEALLESSAEARVDITKLWDNWFGVAVFLDGADVTEEPNALEPGNLHWAAGVGLRYHTPIGPFRFDVGYRLNRKGAGEPDPNEPFAFHLSLGEAF